MFKIPIATKDDINESAKLQRRLQFEDERKNRIFNAKQRLFGLDLGALERQIAEKNKQRQVEAECERRYEDQTQRQQLAIYAKSLEMDKRKRVAEADLNYYRCRFQRKDQRREFDLNDPNRIKRALPARVADDDVRLGISSAQIFSGEDLGHSERKLRQRAQQRAWLDQQVQERKQAEEDRIKADLIMQESIASRDKRLEDMANSERKIRNQMTAAIYDYNTQLAKSKRFDRIREKKENNEDDLAEIYNMLTSDMLTENPDAAQSRTNPTKKIAFMYRGMSADELAKFHEEQLQQKITNKKKQTDQQLMDKQWEQYALNMDRELMLKQLELERNQKQLLDDHIRYNARLAVEQKKQNEMSNKDLNKNYVSKEFYDQFNKTSR
ncbi:RIB43A-like with coiled-coils protein 2 [Bactrocera neohumeralis]|uniref:RIB43A-like with coiled-coils protein 2 n=1 Tax=Bactrocera tryoni TaxID=59916 RepID=UPI001A980B37|nr:RIB43A-like with coiled-coils protein 2 [Bactrocera tryoni]XP_050336871.1 RIB43A-like with coiled-coils protein 2 [Bactrocera neohumeralis]